MNVIYLLQLTVRKRVLKEVKICLILISTVQTVSVIKDVIVWMGQPKEVKLLVDQDSLIISPIKISLMDNITSYDVQLLQILDIDDLWQAQAHHMELVVADISVVVISKSLIHLHLHLRTKVSSKEEMRISLIQFSTLELKGKYVTPTVKWIAVRCTLTTLD